MSLRRQRLVSTLVAMGYSAIGVCCYAAGADATSVVTVATVAETCGAGACGAVSTVAGLKQEDIKTWIF